MPEPQTDHVEKKVIVETSTSTGGNAMTAWIIIGILAVALIVYILVKIT